MFLCAKFSNCSDKEFVDCWKDFYDYGGEENFECYIEKVWAKNYNEALLKLFFWKKGNRRIPEHQQQGINEKIEWLSECHGSGMNKDQIIVKAEEEFLKGKKGGAIWNIFFLFALAPEKWPIFDQHTYRAMKFITTGEIPKDLTTDNQKYKHYKDYVKFFDENFDGCNPRDVDKALFAFGQFLKRYPKLICKIKK